MENSKREVEDGVILTWGEEEKKGLWERKIEYIKIWTDFVGIKIRGAREFILSNTRGDSLKTEVKNSSKKWRLKAVEFFHLKAGKMELRLEMEETGEKSKPFYLTFVGDLVENREGLK